eukprot:SAG11_NODE_20352_length_447_cov_1.017241_1_plen_127_part_10
MFCRVCWRLVVLGRVVVAALPPGPSNMFLRAQHLVNLARRLRSCVGARRIRARVLVRVSQQPASWCDHSVEIMVVVRELCISASEAFPLRPKPKLVLRNACACTIGNKSYPYWRDAGASVIICQPHR